MTHFVGRRALPSPADEAETPLGHGSAGRRAALPDEPSPWRGWSPDEAEVPTTPQGRRAARSLPDEDSWDDEPTGRFALPAEPQGRYAITPPPATAPRPTRAARAAVSDDPKPAPATPPAGRFAFTPPPADAPRPGQRGLLVEDDEPFTDDQPTGRFAAIAPETAPAAPPAAPSRQAAWTPSARVAASTVSTSAPIPPTAPAPAAEETPLSAPTPVRSPGANAPSPIPVAWSEPQAPRTPTPEPEQPDQQPPLEAPAGAALPPTVEVVELPPAEPDRANPMVVEGRRWLAVGVAATALALVVTSVFLAIGGNESIAAPGARPTPPTATALPSQPGPAATVSPSTGVTETPSVEGDAWPVGPGRPATQEPQQSATSDPSPTPSAAEPVVLDLGAAQVPVLPGWQLYADERVQDERRLIRIRNLASDTRIQVVALPNVTGPLTDACTDLINDHRGSYTGVALSMPVTVPVAAGAEGVACSFVGTRTSDDVATRVDFTVVRRDSDATSLIFRDTIPQSVPGDSPARSELVRIECAAADSFGVTISQCAVATPGQVGG